ncbi:MAG: ABC transporter ATP-binding protein [Euryarchaeota archaeon]|nr:ABC transporter ATP-binding protein [Euryarchaeota archaeon]
MQSIVIENITKRYKIRDPDLNWRKYLRQMFKQEKAGYLTALNRINLSVDSGEILGILGPNGAGKTTLIKILAGLLLPEEGGATINSYDIIRDREKVRTSVNILMSGGWIIFDYKLSLFDNLRFWGVIEGVPLREIKTKVDDVLTAVGLYERRNDYPENLSAGLRQKLNLARCLLADRPLYLLDEPTANVDPYSAEFLREHIKTLKKEGKTVVLATHNLWEAEMLCDRIAILNRGEIIALDTTKAVKTKIGKDVLILEVKNASAALTNELYALDCVTHIQEKGTTLEVYGSIKKDIPLIVDLCRKYTTIVSMDMKESSLNEVFIQMITEEEQKTQVKS